MSDQVTDLFELSKDLQNVVAILKATITITNIGGLYKSEIDKAKIVAELATVVVSGVGKDYFDTLDKEWANHPTFRSWELTKLIAKRGSELVAQILSHIYISRSIWIDFQCKLKEITDSITKILMRMEDYRNEPLEFDYVPPDFFNDYGARAYAIEKLADEIYNQASKFR
jgi:hypothetical protein